MERDPRPQSNSELAQAAADLIPAAGTVLSAYAEKIVSVAGNWGSRNNPVRPARVFVDAVSTGTQSLLETSSAEEILIAQQILVGYGFALTYDGSTDTNSGYKSWWIKLRSLANFDTEERTTENTSPSRTANFETERFWRAIYLQTVDPDGAAQALQNYVLGPGTENRDPELLANIADQLMDKTWREIIPKSYLITTPRSGVRAVADTFQRMLTEAAEAGWKNAEIILQMAKERRINAPPHSALISVSNELTALLNKDAATKLEKLRINDPSHLSEALNRCMTVIFDFGAQPEGHDSLNYRLKGQILGKIADEISVLVRK